VLLRILAPSLAASRIGHDSLREACRETRRLTHPNIARVFDLHRDQTLCFLSREFVDGEGLAGLVGQPADEVAARMLPVIDALAYAHARGVIHGDLKTSKLFWDAHGVPRLADFRIAAALREAARALGPPDLEEDPGPPSPSDDVWGLGGVLFELLAGRPLIAADDASIAAGLADGGVPPGLAELVARMRAKPRALRPGIESVRAALNPAASSQRRALPRLDRGDRRLDRDDRRLDADDRHPISASAPAALTPTPTPAPGVTSTRRLIWAAFLVLLLVAAGVFFYLPRWVNDREDRATEPARVVAERPDGAGLAASDAEAKRLLAKTLEARQRLEGLGVEHWASAEVERAGDQIAEGESAQLAGDLEKALREYGDAHTLLRELIERAPVALEQALAAGSAALADGRTDQAIRQFSLAQAIDPDNAAAAAGLSRAGHWSEVSALLAAAERHEEIEQFSKARESYAVALEIDPQSKPAAAGLERVESRLAQREYSQRMSRATRALAQNDLDTALRDVTAAQAVRPGSADAKALRAQIASLQTAQATARHLTLAQARENEADWSGATDEYRAVLSLDPEASAAKEGLARSELGARLSGRFGEWIAQSDRLLDKRQRTEAGALLAEARNFHDPPANLANQMHQVAGLLSAFSASVTVVLESDSETEVTIQKLRELGSFERREIELEPGTYVVVGIRRGYRDVRHTLTVKPGRAAPPLMVRCTKPI
jgi:tetratricopeptide (TPR) repeat protein